MNGKESLLANVFKDAKKHQEIAGIIKDHLQSKADIRQLALDGLDLSSSKKILDLGCGFGFFTEALKGRVSNDAIITGIDRFPEYEWFFFQSCNRADIRADFRSDGIKYIETLKDNSYDLVLCSYAMYFFPEAVKHVSRILKKDGCFIAITHVIPHMPEFEKYVRNILKKNGLIVTIDLPYESLISRFSDKNGESLLKQCFAEVASLNYSGKLCFKSTDHEALISYLNFKHHFFIPEDIDPDDILHGKLVKSIRHDLRAMKGMEITKNDVIFICSKPLAIS